MATTDVPDGGAYTTSEHLAAQRGQLDDNLKPLPTLGAGEQAQAPQTGAHADSDQQPSE